MRPRTVDPATAAPPTGPDPRPRVHGGPGDIVPVERRADAFQLEPRPPRRPDADVCYAIRPLGADWRDASLALAHGRLPRGRPDLRVLPTLDIRDGRGDALLCSVRSTGADAYEVHDAEGVLLARISRRPGRLLPWPRRVLWTVRPAPAGSPLTGKDGTWYAWALYVVLAPLWLPVRAALAVYSLLGTVDDPGFANRPRLVRWHGAAREAALEARGPDGTVWHLDPQRVDPRIAYALAVVTTW